MMAKKITLGLASLGVVALAAFAVAQGPGGIPAPQPTPNPAGQPPPAGAPRSAFPAAPAAPAAAAPAAASVPVVATADGLTTMPAALKPPAEPDLHELMEAMKVAHRGATDANPELAMRAAREVERLSIAAGHESLRIPKDDYIKLLADLYWKNQDVQKAIAAKAGQEEVMKAYQAQNASCNACHKVYRKKEK